MAIQIFANKLSNRTASISKTLLETLQTYANIDMSKDTNGILNKQLSQDIYVGLDKSNGAFVHEPLKDTVVLNDSIPMLLRYANDQPQTRSLIPPKHIHAIRKFIHEIEDMDTTLQLFVDELEGMRHQLKNYKAKTSDARINISVYPTLRTFITDYIRIGVTIEDDKYIEYRTIDDIITRVYEIAVYASIREIRKTKPNDDPAELPDVYALDVEQKVKFNNLNYHYVTTPISN